MGSLKWGLIGCGDIAQKRVAPALRDLPQCDLHAITRSQTNLAESFANEFGARKSYRSCNELLTDKEIEAVYIATPVHLHAVQTIAAAEAGKHVLCEKPMAMNVKECDEMIAACRANNVKLGIAYYRHFYPVIGRIKSVIQSGKVGTPVLVQINAFEWFDPKPEHARYWLVKKELAGGGPMFDFGCHRIEVLVDVFGPVEQVTSMVSNVVFDREVEDTATALFQFRGGTCGVLSVTHAAVEPRDTLDVFGTQGSIHVPVLNGSEMRIKTSNCERVESHAPASNVHEPLIENFVEAVLMDLEPRVNGDIGRMVTKIEEEIYVRSSR
ncbi:MAG: gfo/Idh/MocA family oxidoreductase [Acidobacteria bacterium]|nr:MAG: gfo/Idh/MocA family oxidoreductase [Acidobacteriota bacterium]